jgi:hypothetical protein
METTERGEVQLQQVFDWKSLARIDPRRQRRYSPKVFNFFQQS